ncbi:CDP-alcohol phosphatidyltransferase family protein [Caulobacter hibisci]|uniref:CDP-diacylglycerol--glycerol-3-phosphate 3-phosphatidyltransferase n=1 Tax=Caulobacter hibisci TaxID=2035993 RepID=A0ABS0SVC6_9CAUL|nr:CDP-alcohol phosphatidyltransferase family protein [Caulobacter hibisci]MBI1683590.1 CDP-alcohol phosphatidyltransferase family protein [Caulobacter hibisci]
MLPNLLTALRLLALPFLAWAVMADAGWAALALFLGAGLTDVLDGWIARRFGLTSAFGAMFDLLADRLLTLVSLGALMAAGAFPGAWIVVPLLLIARNFFVAGLQQAQPGRDFNYPLLEHPKIALNFLGVSLLLAPIGSEPVGLWVLAASAALSVVTVTIYARRAASHFTFSQREKEGPAPKGVGG